jgi:predicted GIY-YIG superfamily endonuclease
MSALMPVADEEGNVYERPSRVGMWVGGIEQLRDWQARKALAPYSGRTLNAVYRLYACDGTLLYVGITNDPMRRWKQHADTKDWWPEVDHLVLVPFETADTARYMERWIIRSERPIYNRQHSRRRWLR